MKIIYECEHCHAQSLNKEDIVKCEASHIGITKESSSDKWELYTDGGCRGNPGLGAFAWILLKNGCKVASGSKAFRKTTNNRMEMMAVGAALSVLSKSNFDKSSKLTIYSDSQLIIGTLSLGWKRNQNLDIWKIVDEARAGFSNLTYVKVKGHSDNEWNIAVDRLVNETMDKSVVEGVALDRAYEEKI